MKSFGFYDNKSVLMQNENVYTLFICSSTVYDVFLRIATMRTTADCRNENALR